MKLIVKMLIDSGWMRCQQMNHPTRQLQESAAHSRTVIGIVFSIPFIKSAVIYAKYLRLLATVRDPSHSLALVGSRISILFFF